MDKEKKEIGKLLEYLTEFASEDFNWEYRDGKIYDRQDMYPDGDLLEEMSTYVISKKFGFIKRLVENDKIDLDKIERYSFFGYTYYQSLLMLLSISSSPIEDLISYLK